MSWIEQLFEKHIVNVQKCLNYGFIQTKHYLIYQTSIRDGAFDVRVEIKRDGSISCHCLDSETKEEYMPVHSSKGVGSYAALVKEEYVGVLEDVVEKCFDKAIYSKPQTQRILEWVRETFLEDVEFIFKKNETVILRNKNNAVWYAVLFERNGEEGIDVKLDPEMIQTLLKQDGFLPAWHMNKTHWIQIALNDTLKDQIIKDCLSMSRGFTLSKHKTKVDSDMWLVPSNPKYYDVVGALEYEDTILWSRHTNIKVNDTVFLYVGKPYSAILYQFKVLEIDEARKLMLLKKDKQFDPTACTLSKMRMKGVNTPRGSRTMPKELLELLK